MRWFAFCFAETKGKKQDALHPYKQPPDTVMQRDDHPNIPPHFPNWPRPTPYPSVSPSRPPVPDPFCQGVRARQSQVITPFHMNGGRAENADALHTLKPPNYSTVPYLPSDLLLIHILVLLPVLCGLGCFSNFLFPEFIAISVTHTGHNSSYPRDLVPIPVATSNILKKMTDPNLPTMRTRINGLALTLAEKSWAQKELDAHPDLATTWTPETDVNLIAFIKQSATQSAPPGPLWGSPGLSGSISHKAGLEGNMNLPIEDRQDTIKALFSIVKNNWKNRLESVKQKHTLGYLCGLAGIGKTTMLSILKAHMQALAEGELDEEFKESIRDSVYITISLGNGDSWEGEEFDNLIASRMFIRFSQGCSWATRNNGTLSARSFGTVDVYKCIGATIEKSSGWRAVFIMVDDCQFISPSQQHLRSFAHIICRLMTEQISKEDPTTITAHFKTYIIPIFAGTLLPEQVRFFATISDFTTEDIQLPLLSADHALGICHKLQTIKSHPALQDSKVQTLIKQYGVIPRMLEAMIFVLEEYPTETRPDILERFFEIEFANVYKPKQILSSFGEDGKQLVLYSLANVSLSQLEEGSRMREKMRDFSFKGCLHLDDGHITVPHHVLSLAIKEYRIPFTMHKISDKVHWQNFEKVIFSIPGAISAAPYSAQKYPIIPNIIQYDQRQCVTRKPHTYNPEREVVGGFLHPPPNGTFLCFPGNPVFDIRICTTDEAGCHLIWEQLWHEELDTRAEDKVTTTMIEKWYTQAKGVTRGSEFNNPPLLVYITNHKLDPYLSQRTLAKFLENRPDLAIITRDQLADFLPPCILHVVLSADEGRNTLG
ncbi:hypothetical protein PROFUN_09724 [Planoprotostelium fungivorum]|uniref:Uncharacterized protein n=1 Tax=Planoprotostelium fungivorum TaxID=1890364 RepID=A0A2P6NEU3_9EUKA|nr:hypothetical protein PROFUN_09724 [Planoprotostelium fungivorum]